MGTSESQTSGIILKMEFIQRIKVEHINESYNLGITRIDNDSGS